MPLPETMPAAVFKQKGEVAIEDWPVPALGPGDVLIEVSHCGICGSDIHFVLDGWGHPNTIGGHEQTGTIVAVGADAGGWSVGDPVVVGPSPKCGECGYCKARRPSLCMGRGDVGGGDYQGAFAGYQRVPAASLYALPDGVTLRTAALAEPLAVALHGITNSGITNGQRALVLGAGPIGLLIIAGLRAMGVDDITVTEPGERRRQRALDVGAARGLIPSDLAEPPMPYDVHDDGYDVSFECSGRADAQEMALAQLKRAGTLVLVGAGIKKPQWDANRILLNELVVTGANCYDFDGFDKALALLARPDFPVDLLIEPEDVPLGGILDAMHGLKEGRLPGKVMVVPS
jgi:(R,R)-butanediol dehydrogenase/meso-butanediol dehydrogenase/diacetyl reductase